MNLIEEKLSAIIDEYDKLVKSIDTEAINDPSRAYGGVVRSKKGQLVENITTQLIQIAWNDVLRQNPLRIKINKKKMPIGINDSYIDRLSDSRMKAYVQANKANLVYMYGTDVHVFIDDQLVLPIECKAYTENAMLKRILFDASLMKEAKGIGTYYLVQLESQLGGDYSEQNEFTYGSPATHALLAHCDVNLKIITLLKGERKVDRPIHKKEFFKELQMRELEKTVSLFANDLDKYRK